MAVGSMPLGAHMGSSALNIHTGHKYCPNGNMGVGPNQLAASARPGVREGDHGPSRRPSEIAHFAGKMLQRSGVPAFGCADGLVSHLRSNVAVEDYPDEALHLRLEQASNRNTVAFSSPTGKGSCSDDQAHKPAKLVTAAPTRPRAARWNTLHSYA
jgi:hypothetical protein